MSADQEDSKPLRMLVVDPDGSLWEEVQAEFKILKKASPESPPPTPKFADTVRASQSMISDRDFDYAAIFVNPSLGSPAWFSVIRTSLQYRAGVPVYVIYDKPPKISQQEAGKLGVHGFLKKPITYAKMLELVAGEPEEAQIEELTPEESEKKDAAPPPDDNLYEEVTLANISGKHKSMFDLYVKLSNNKYVKVLNSGDVLSQDRLESYKAKGMKALYILKSAQSDYLAFYDSMVANLLKDETVSADVKAVHVATQGKDTLNFIKNTGFSEASITAAMTYVNNTTEVVNQIAGKSDLVKKLLDDVVAYEHSTACATLAGLMLKHIGGNNPAIFSAIGIGCFLHDIALLGQPPDVLEEDETLMTPEQKVLYLAHPEEGAKLVKKMKNVPPVVAVAIAHHHLRIHKGGFPQERAADEINKMGELIGLCHEFLALVKKSKADPKIDPYLVLKERAVKEFSPELVSAFVRTFEEK